MIIEKYYTVADTAVCIAADEKIMYGDDGVLAPFALASVSGGVVRYEYEISDSLPDSCGTPTVSRPDIAEFGEGENTVRYIGRSRTRSTERISAPAKKEVRFASP